MNQNSLSFSLLFVSEEYHLMNKMETPAPAVEATLTKKVKKTRGPTMQPKPAFVLAVDSCSNLLKKNMAKFADFSGGFRSLSDLVSFKKKGKKN